MATTLRPVDQASEKSSAMVTATGVARAIVEPLASLKLTVFLLIGAVLVTWIATLDQARIDVWELKEKHFRSFLVQVPFSTLFVPKWFPGLQGIQGSFYIPSGMTLMVAMLINLTSAHLLRFKIKASGWKLGVGIAVGLVAAAMTWMVIFNRSDASGLQTQPADWTRMWSWMQVLLLGLSLFSLAGAWITSAEKRVERMLMIIGGVLGIGILTLLFALGEKAFIGDSAMRILWQLLQSTIVGLVGLTACIMLFHRKAGIVLLHLGIAGLMVNEIYVTMTNEEQRMQIKEGQTVNTTFDVRSNELVVVDRSDPETDRIVTIPHSKIFEGAVIEHDDFPFTIEIADFYRNSDTFPSETGTRASEGLGQFFISNEKPVVAGAAASSETNMASCYVRIYEKNEDEDDEEKLLGEWLLGQGLYLAYGMDTVTVDDKQWNLALRFKTAYKPYEVTLTDVQREDYLGTEVPRWYSSDIVFVDPENGVETNQKIIMNNPLRYSGETFYQSGYDMRNGTESTVLQVVRNRGWMTPYVCCMLVVVGLVAQFGSSLLTFIEKRRKSAVKSGDKGDNPFAAPMSAKDAPEQTSGSSESWVKRWLPVIIAGVFFLWVGNEFRSAGKPLKNGEMRLDLFGQIPVAYEGRVKPLDSVARNLARNLSNRERVIYDNPIPSQSDHKEEAIRWLADTMFRVDGYENYQIFRIEDLNVQQALGLTNRKGLKFTFQEIEDAKPELDRLVETFRSQPESEWSLFEARLYGVRDMVERIEGVRIPMLDTGEVTNDPMVRLNIASQIARAEGAPMIIPTGDPEEAWVSLADDSNRQWLGEIAQQYGVDDAAVLALTLSEEYTVQPWIQTQIVKGLIEDIVRDEEDLEQIKEITGETSLREIIRLLQNQETWASIPRELYADNMESVEEFVREEAEVIRRDEGKLVYGMIKDIFGGEVDKVVPPDNELAELFRRLAPAYRDKDAGTFNSTLVAYLDKVNTDSPEGMNVAGVKLESFFNNFAPFYIGMVLFLVAFVVTTVGWIVWQKPMNQTASLLLVLAFVVVTAGLVMRVIISGRPPITNLYTTFLFVAAASVPFALVVERLTKVGAGNIVGSLIGYLTLLWAWTMTIQDGDSFTVLVAVLDTQFWLSTHVVIVTMGYVATLLAGTAGVVFITIGIFSTSLAKQSERRLLANMIYGLVCFGLLFSFFGTVLGGLWADDSWGRFWGWDPKENGALMIVLWNAVVLHARWAGIIRERGLAGLAIVGNILTMWSWIAVNEMGVGLHAYADSEASTMQYVTMFWAVMIGFSLAAIIPTKFWRSYRNEAA
ncbi:MAG: cytochrome c biogenesis protein CcsA [Planctomycetota bacterium]